MNLHKNNHLVTVVGLPQPKKGEETCYPILCVPSIIAPYAILYHLHGDIIKLKHFPRYWPFVAGKSSGTGELPLQRPVRRSFDVFFDLRLNRRLSKHSRRWWFETPSRLSRRHYSRTERCFATEKLLIACKKAFSWTAFRQLVFH